ncbi:hypothetical protein [Bacteroides thetaiotaomicron]|jgi:hypothetical protein|uniref:Uncharacterized protein n=1 Tax=Bacteroides thetaiotaomicron TaxID=818 RepID=A0AAP3SFL6_BACT4|nr:hypothetical protein [Bacteroides thetaiotaomicron]MDC2220993.1 hypothetical protein [Bacteroides thetaiotaomicron]MDC2228181.1 hypothetical protein [Bacteroides thetaiotaomicron]MDC2236678.1 hypothetical protein [Bacteroides thetaiotaomicron]
MGKAVHLYEVYTIPTVLVLQQRQQHPKGCVPYGLCKVVVALNGQSQVSE